MNAAGKPDREERVGIRELRQNLSVFIERVKRGEELEVTEHGRLVARIVPAQEGQSSLERLIAQGKATRAKGRIADLPPLTGPITDALSRALEQEREERL